MKRIAIFGAKENVAGCYMQAKRLGYYLVAIAEPISEECRAIADVSYDVDFSDVDRVADICKKEKIDGITSFTLESAIPFIVEVSKRLGLNSNSRECVERIRSKYTQREAMAAAGIPTPSFVRILPNDTIPFDRIKYPCIVKPIDSGGSQGIFKVSKAQDVEEAVKLAKSKSRTEGVIVEDYVDGREFSVEYLSYKGKHYFCQLTDKVTSGEPLFVEIAHHQPSNVTDLIKDRIKAMVENALDALNIENSASHTEIKLNSQGQLYIIEIGARMGGDKITERLVKMSTGIDFLAKTIEIACDTFTPPVVLFNQYSGVYHYSALFPQVGKYIKENIKPEGYSIETRLFKNTLDEVHSNADRSGYLLYQSTKGRLEIS